MQTCTEHLHIFPSQTHPVSIPTNNHTIVNQYWSLITSKRFIKVNTR